MTAIAPGTQIGPYEATGWLGAGGMGEVQRPYALSGTHLVVREPNRMIDVHPDGQRFAVAVDAPFDDPVQNHITTDTDFFGLLPRLAPRPAR